LTIIKERMLCIDRNLRGDAFEILNALKKCEAEMTQSYWAFVDKEVLYMVNRTALSY
jgi:hypothetical protein